MGSGDGALKRAARAVKRRWGPSDDTRAAAGPSPRDDREGLLERLPKGGIGAEIGTWKGDFAVKLLKRLSPQRLYLIDPWLYRGEAEYEQAMYGGNEVPGRQADMEAIYEGVLARFGAGIAAGTVQVVRASSLDAAGAFDDELFDWVYIDGDHLYESVKSDLEAYYRKVKPGGYLAGDDYGYSGWWDHGVTRAVDEFAELGICEGPVIVGTQFIFRRT